MPQQNLKDLEILVRSCTRIVHIETHEEKRILDLFQDLVPKLGRPVFRWTITTGLERIDESRGVQRHARQPVELLTQILGTQADSIYILLDFHPFLSEPAHVRLLKDIALCDSTRHTVILVSHKIDMPGELEPFTARFELALPDRERVEAIVREEANAWSRMNANQRISVDRDLFNRFTDSLLGLPIDDVRRMVRNAIQDDGVLDESGVQSVMQAKFDLLAEGGVLSFEYDTARFSDVGGLSQLKRWLDMRRVAFTGEPPPGLDAPKGIMLLGVQGCGKSLAAKAVAGAWGVPLLQLDAGSLYNRFYGETERNLRESLKTAEVMAPCVLWIDEIEKAIGTEQNDGGTSRRVLGTFLTWMAEKKARVFIVATANDIQALPPELVRKGRLDEVFFVDLPDAAIRAEIFRIHLQKREQDATQFNLQDLAEASDGFSGAEIEQAVVSALYTVYGHAGKLEQSLLLEEIQRTRPLSVLMGERIHSLRQWAEGRTVRAD